MPNTSSKSHKSRKTEGEPKPRQRKSSLAQRLMALPSVAAQVAEATGSSLVESPSSLVPATTAPLPPIEKPAEKSDDNANVVPTELPDEQQPWYRKPTAPVRKRAEKIAVMMAAGRDTHYIAKKLGITEGRIRVIKYLARKNRWWDDNDEPFDAEAELAFSIDRKIVRNLSSSLDGQMTNWQTHEMTIAAAKGRGHFKNHDKVADDQSTKMQVVAIRIEMPPLGAQHQIVDEANIGGVPAYIDAEIEEPKALGAGDVLSATRDDGGEAHEADSAAVQHQP